MKPHKHAELIKAWADGAEIQVFNGEGWLDSLAPTWHPGNQYRIKPEPKPDVIRWCWATERMGEGSPNTDSTYASNSPNLVLRFDGETGELKLAKVL